MAHPPTSRRPSLNPARPPRTVRAKTARCCAVQWRWAQVTSPVYVPASELQRVAKSVPLLHISKCKCLESQASQSIPECTFFLEDFSTVCSVVCSSSYTCAARSLFAGSFEQLSSVVPSHFVRHDLEFQLFLRKMTSTALRSAGLLGLDETQ